MAHYVYLAGHIKNEIFMIPEMATWNFSSNTTRLAKKHLLNDKFLASTLLYSYSILKPGQE